MKRVLKSRVPVAEAEAAVDSVAAVVAVVAEESAIAGKPYYS